MENCLVTYGFNKERERIEHLKRSVINSAKSSGKKNYWKCDCQELFERKLVVYFVLDYSRNRFFMETV